MDFEGKDLKSALDNCEKALFYLHSALNELNRAYGWGVADILGGALFISLAKRKKMENADKDLLLAKNNINRMLRIFNSDTSITSVDFMPGGFLSTTDFLFDNIVSDIMVQEKIRNARASVNETIAKLESIREKLVAALY
jgi:hypothetical protein